MWFKYSPGDVIETRKSCDTEIAIKNGLEFKCQYFINMVSIKLYNDGTAELNSSPVQ